MEGWRELATRGEEAPEQLFSRLELWLSAMRACPVLTAEGSFLALIPGSVTSI